MPFFSIYVYIIRRFPLLLLRATTRTHIYLVPAIYHRSNTCICVRVPLRIILFSGKQYNVVSSYQEVCCVPGTGADN